MTAALIDASSAILLFKAGLINLSCRAFKLYMTRSVYEEVTVPTRPGAADLHALVGRQPGIVRLDDPAGSHPGSIAYDIGRLHRGERDTVKHYLSGIARFVIIDDGKGAQVCRRHGIPHVNALLLPKLLYYSNRLTTHESRRFFLGIQALGRYSTPVVAWAKKCDKSDLTFFLGDRGAE